MKRILMLLGLCALICHAGCKSKEENKEAPSKLLVTSPLRSDTTVTQEYVCQIRSIRNIEIRAQEKGYLQNVYVDEGQFEPKTGTDVSSRIDFIFVSRDLVKKIEDAHVLVDAFTDNYSDHYPVLLELK